MTNKPHHNTGRRHAAKNDDEKALAHIHMRCHPDDKGLLERNMKPGEKLTSFMLGLAVNEAKRRAEADKQGKAQVEMKKGNSMKEIWDGNCGRIGAIAEESKYFRSFVDETVADLRAEKYAKSEAVLQLEEGIQIQVIITRDEEDFLPIEE